MSPQIGDVRISKGLFGFAKDKPEEVSARIDSNLEYILALEYGHSAQAPVGMVRINMARMRRLAQTELQHALATQTDPQEALLQAIVGATLAAEAVIVTDTPVEFGTAKGSWTTRLPKEAGGIL